MLAQELKLASTTIVPDKHFRALKIFIETLQRENINLTRRRRIESFGSELSFNSDRNASTLHMLQFVFAANSFENRKNSVSRDVSVKLD